MSASQSQNDSQEGNQQFLNEDEEKKESFSTPQFPQQHESSSIPSQTHSHININNTNHPPSIPRRIRSISAQSVPIQANIHKYPNMSQFTANTSSPSPHSIPPNFLASKSLSHLTQTKHIQHQNSNNKNPPLPTNIKNRYFNHSKYYQYITTEIQLITTIIHQHLTISNANNSSTSNIHKQKSLLHSSSSSSVSQSLNGSAASYTLKQWQINNFFQNLLKQFEYTRFSMSFNDSLVFHCYPL